MIFLSLIAVMGIIYWSKNTASMLQRDGWFIWFLNRLRTLPAVSSFPLLPMILALVLPLVVMMICIWAIVDFLSANFLFFLYVPVLIYSLGRGDFLADVNNYIAVADRGDSVASSKLVDDLRGHAADDTAFYATNDWKSLHMQALKVFSYRGFERTFAVLFWFVIAGAVGALLYRLSAIYREQTIPGSSEAVLAEKWLWLIEFPAVRLMGLTWAFVGNFDSCPIRDSLLDTEHSSMTVLNNSLRGALGAPIAPRENVQDEDVQTTDASTVDTPDDLQVNSNDVTENIVVAETIVVEPVVVGPIVIETTDVVTVNTESEHQAEEIAQDIIEDLVGITLNTHAEPAYSFALVKSSAPLYSRSLLFWVGAIAFATLFI